MKSHLMEFILNSIFNLLEWYKQLAKSNCVNDELSFITFILLELRIDFTHEHYSFGLVNAIKIIG